MGYGFTRFLIVGFIKRIELIGYEKAGGRG
jgi:hypothetical protein